MKIDGSNLQRFIGFGDGQKRQDQGVFLLLILQIVLYFIFSFLPAKILLKVYSIYGTCQFPKCARSGSG